jgi:hypothetical protein
MFRHQPKVGKTIQSAIEQIDAIDSPLLVNRFKDLYSDIFNDYHQKQDAKKKGINFCYVSKRFLNITTKDINGWSDAYPGVRVTGELKKMREWCLANPKNRKSNWRRFITNWLTRAQNSSRPRRRGRGINSEIPWETKLKDIS